MLDTPWRRIATSIFDAPDSGRILVRVEVNVEPLEAYLAATPGLHRTLGLLHFVAAAAGRAIAQDAPALNGYLKRGAVHARDGVTVSITTPLPADGGLLALPLADAHRRSASDLAVSLWQSIKDTRDRARRQALLPEYVLARVPWPVRRAAFRTLRGLAGLGLPMARVDLAPQSLGAVILTSMEPLVRGFPAGEGRFDAAFVPRFPAARDATILAIIPAQAVPVVVGGEVVVQRRATLCATFDHRLVDGREVGLFLQSLGRRLIDPEGLDAPVPPSS